MKIDTKTKDETTKKKTEISLIICFVMSALITFIFWLRNRNVEFLNLTNLWGQVCILGTIFSFSFGLFFVSSRWEKYKNKIKINKPTIFLIISMIISGAATYTAQYTTFREMIFAFSLSTGICYAIFTIFHRFDYTKIERYALNVIKKLAYGVLFPSMFLMIALIGKIDNDGSFLIDIENSLVGNISSNSAGYSIGNGFYKAIEYVYNLGKIKYSGLIMLTIFVFLIFFSLMSLFKKNKDEPDYTPLPKLENNINKPSKLDGALEAVGIALQLGEKHV